MSKTPFSDKVTILAELWLNYREQAAQDEAWSSFFAYNDIALPMSYCLAENLVLLNEEDAGKEIIEETWKIFCEYIDIDVDGKYENIAEAFAASSNPPLETIDE